MTTSTAVPLPADGEPIWTVERLAALTGFTVRTVRYYGTLGLLPPPERRGRVAFYDDRHRARLDLVRTMQEQGMNLAAIEQHLAQIPSDSPASEVDLRRAVLHGWGALPVGLIDRVELERQAGRALSNGDLDVLQRLGTLRSLEGGFEPGPTFGVGLDLLDLDIPVESMEAAGDAMRRHMDALVLELRDILRAQVLAPMRERHLTDTDHFARTMIRLRQLTLEALVANFQQATNGLVDGSLLGRHEGDS